jgi:hypothetical protein
LLLLLLPWTMLGDWLLIYWWGEGEGLKENFLYHSAWLDFLIRIHHWYPVLWLWFREAGNLDCLLLFTYIFTTVFICLFYVCIM